MSRFEESLENIAAGIFDWASDGEAGLDHLTNGLSGLLKKAEQNEFPKDACEIIKAVVPAFIVFAANQREALKRGQDPWGDLRKAFGLFQESLMHGKNPSQMAFPFTVAASLVVEMPQIIDESLVAEFCAKMVCDLEDLENMAVKMDGPDNPEIFAAIKRMVHTLKGESGVLNLMDIQKVCHQVEDRMVAIGSGDISEVILQLVDWLKIRCQELQGKVSGKALSADGFLQQIALLLDAKVAEEIKVETSPACVKPEAESQPAPPYDPDPNNGIPLEDETFIQEFLNEAGDHLNTIDQSVLSLEKNPHNMDALNAIFRAYHTIKGISAMLGLEDLRQLAHVAETLLDLARQDKMEANQKFIDIIFESSDRIKTYLEAIAKAITTTRIFQRDRNGLKLIEKITLFSVGKQETKVPEQIVQNVVSAAPTQQTTVVPVAAEKPVVTSSPAVAASTAAVNVPVLPKDGTLAQSAPVSVPTPPKVAVPAPAAASSPAKAPLKIREMIKVDTDVLDKILNTIGELVISESMVQRDIRQLPGVSLATLGNIRQLEKITRELQEMGTSLRMTSVKPLFEKMARLVRDVGKKTNKVVNFAMEGEDTELDRSVVERISDPLVHMIRNSVDHGIEENAEERVLSGKDLAGTVKLRALHKSGNVHIQIIDDGRGINKDVILRKAIEKGLVAEGQKMSDEEIFNLIFLPGFSTAKVVTDVSGRGVGMDVVKKNIEALRGRIQIESEVGKGSVFTIILPLTLAIIDGMIVDVAGENYIVPTISIRESIKVPKDKFNYALGKGESVMVRNQLVPVLRLNTVFGIKAKADSEKRDDDILVVIVENAGKNVALMVDNLIGQQQIVIKNLGTMFKDLKGFSGGAIMADGSVGLIIDVPTLVECGHSTVAA